MPAAGARYAAGWDGAGCRGRAADPPGPGWIRTVALWAGVHGRLGEGKTHVRYNPDPAIASRARRRGCRGGARRSTTALAGDASVGRAHRPDLPDGRIEGHHLRLLDRNMAIRARPRICCAVSARGRDAVHRGRPALVPAQADA